MVGTHVHTCAPLQLPPPLLTFVRLSSYVSACTSNTGMQSCEAQN